MKLFYYRSKAIVHLNLVCGISPVNDTKLSINYVHNLLFVTYFKLVCRYDEFVVYKKKKKTDTSSAWYLLTFGSANICRLWLSTEPAIPITRVHRVLLPLFLLRLLHLFFCAVAANTIITVVVVFVVVVVVVSALFIYFRLFIRRFLVS